MVSRQFSIEQFFRAAIWIDVAGVDIPSPGRQNGKKFLENGFLKPFQESVPQNSLNLQEPYSSRKTFCSMRGTF